MRSLRLSIAIIPCLLLAGTSHDAWSSPSPGRFIAAVKAGVQRGVFNLQQRRLLRQVGQSRQVSRDLRGEVGQTRAAITGLRRAADRVQLSVDKSGGRVSKVASYYKGDALLGTIALNNPIAHQRTLTVTTFQGDNSSSRQIFRTGRGGARLVLGEVTAALRGKQTWELAKKRIVHGIITAGSDVTVSQDISKQDRRERGFRIEQWRSIGRGFPANVGFDTAAIPPGQTGRKAVAGRVEQRISQYRLDAAGNRIPHPDPEAGGRPIRDTLHSFQAPYVVSPQGEPVFLGQAQAR